MNAARNMKIDFRVNGKHDHYIQKESNPVAAGIKKTSCTKKRKR